MDKIRTIGTIEHVCSSDSGGVYYIVNVEVNGKAIKAKSYGYSNMSKRLPIGKRVAVDYWESNGSWFTNYKHCYLCDILDEEALETSADKEITLIFIIISTIVVGSLVAIYFLV